MKTTIHNSSILVQPLEQKKQGILTSLEKKPPVSGIVLEVSADITKISIGDTVYFPEHSGTPIYLEQEKVLVVRYTDILLSTTK